jgi:hypothetical protein
MVSDVGVSEFSYLSSLLNIMKGLFLIVVILLTAIFHLDAFLPSERRRYQQQRHTLSHTSNLGKSQSTRRFQSETKEDFLLNHTDIVWKVRPPPNTVSRRKRLWLRLAANIIRLDCLIKGQQPPLVLCPKGGQAVLEAHYRPNDSSKYKKIARFGFTTERGPTISPIRETVHDVYGLNQDLSVGVGAIIYMYVEEPYRKRNVGSLALEVISLIHAIQGCDFTVLVADDNGSGKLIQWYEEQGYSKAPKLQECFGSPNGVHGVTMIAPTRQVKPQGCFIKWW